MGYLVSSLGIPKTLYTCWPNFVGGGGGDEAASSPASAWAQSQVGVN